MAKRPRARATLPVRVGRDAVDGIVVDAVDGRAASLHLTPRGASPRTGEVAGAHVLFRDVWRSTNVFYKVAHDRIKEVVVLKDERAPTSSSWRVTLDDALRLRPRSDGGVEVVDDLDAVLVVLEPPFVVDARARLIALAWQVVGESVSVNVPAGLSHPVALDPTIGAPVHTWQSPFFSKMSTTVVSSRLAADAARGAVVALGRASLTPVSSASLHAASGTLAVQGTTATSLIGAHPGPADLDGRSEDVRISIQVDDVPRAPAIDVAATLTVNEGEEAAVEVSVADLDGDEVTPGSCLRFAEPAPAFARLYTDGTLLLDSGFDDAGVYTLTVACDDPVVSGLFGTATVEITVANVNRAPFVAVALSVSAPEGQATRTAIVAGDPDGDAVSATAALVEEDARIVVTVDGDDLVVTPSFDAVTNREVTRVVDIDITVCDDRGLASTVRLPVTIEHVNRAPRLTAPRQVAAVVGTPVSFSVAGADDDGDDILISLEPRPAGAAFDGTRFA